MIGRLKVEDFEPLVGSGFTIDAPEHSETLTLTEAKVSKHQTESQRAFSVIFRGSSTDTLIHSQLVSLKHAEMGQLDIMISPIGRNDDGTVNYEAVFN